MKRNILFVGVVLSALAGPIGQARPSCVVIDAPVKHYLSTHHGWFLTNLNDMDSADIELWNAYHGSFCPEVAIVHLSPSNEKTSYALSLNMLVGGHVRQKLIVLMPRLHDYRVVQLSENAVGIYNGTALEKVVWRTGPGLVMDNNSKKKVHLTQDGIVYETMEAGASVYYYKGGRFRSITTAD